MHILHELYISKFTETVGVFSSTNEIRYEDDCFSKSITSVENNYELLTNKGKAADFYRLLKSTRYVIYLIDNIVKFYDELFHELVKL